MRHVIVRLTVLIAAVAVAAVSAPGAFAAGEIVWLEKVYNFGAFGEESGPVRATFRFVNVGDEPVVITGVRASCGCTTPTYAAAAVAPGDTAAVYAEYDPQARPGRFSKSVTVNTNAANAPKTKLTLKGVVVGSPSTVAARFPVDGGLLQLSRNALLCGDLAHSHLKTVFFDAYNTTMDTVTTWVTDMPKWLDVHTVTQTVAPGEQVTYSVFVKGDGDDMWGVVADTITINASSPAGVSAFRLPVVVTVSERFDSMTDEQRAKAPAATVTEPNIFRGKVPSGPVKGEFEVENTGRTPLLIRRVYTMTPGVSIKVSSRKVKPGKKARITVIADGDTPVVSARVMLVTNDPAAPVQTLRLTAERL